MGTNQRVYLTAISVYGGIITLIEQSGEIALYRQRGINNIPYSALTKLIAQGKLDANWERYTELPKHYSIAFEDTEIMGRARASFPYKQG